jgi:drug/metabolite transporter (DMT)-like permease
MPPFGIPLELRMNEPRLAAPRVPGLVWAGLAAVIVLDTAVQLVWKSVVLPVPDGAGLGETFVVAAAQPGAWLLAGLFVVMFCNWMLLLAKADLSYVQPITALSYVTVAAGSAIVFGEQVSLTRSAGLVLVLAGVWLISGTNHRTAALPGPSTEAAP